MIQSSSHQRLADYLTVGEAAELLGVSPWTLRNWDKSGKLKPRRHPKNGYRIYRHEDLTAVLSDTDRGASTPIAGATTPVFTWAEVGPAEHFVQFYDTDEFLAESVAGFVATALGAGDAGIVIATDAHRQAVLEKLREQGVDVGTAIEEGRFVALDAAETLAEFMADGSPHPARFASSVGEIVAGLTRSGRRLHAFGEMVALLWAEGNKAGAIALEGLWNDLAKVHRFALMCGYTMGAVAGSDNDESFGSVCTCHTRVLPAEGYAALPSGEARMREVARLQQKARSLEAEIAHRAQVENALSSRERELADFFDNATEGIHRVGPDGTILWANKAELDLLGYAADEYIGHPVADFHADKDVICEMLNRLLAGESLINEPARMLCKDGSIRHVLVNSNGYFEDGKLVHTRCFTRDVTDRVLAEQERARLAAAELEASQAEARRRTFFLNAISHDLRTPLNGLVLQANLARLSADMGDSATLAETLTQIESSVAATSDLLNALLEAARTGGPPECGTVEAFALDEMVSRLLSGCRAAADQKGLSILAVVPAGVCVVTERVKLERVLLNLLDNAVKFTAAGSVHVEAQRTGADVAIHVVDTGVGIADEEQARLFEEFYQVNNPERDRRKGFGLGLAVAHRLAAQLGGTLALESEPGRGSRFTLTLPGVAREA